MTFEEYIAAYDAICADEARLKAELKPISAKRLAMAKAITEQVQKAMGAAWKEGVNNYPMPDGRVLKVTYSLDRKIEQAEIENARTAYGELNTPQPVVFDDLLRVKYELAKREWDKLDDDAKRTVSNMITTKPSTPKVELD